MKQIITYKNHFGEFVQKLTPAEQQKLRKVLALLKTEERMPRHYVKFLRDGVYELRVTCPNTELRVVCIYDGDTIVVLFNAFKKKTQKTPDQEIKKAIKLKEEYYESKGN